VTVDLLVCPMGPDIRALARADTRCRFLHPRRCRARQGTWRPPSVAGTRASPGSRPVRQRRARGLEPGVARSPTLSSSRPNSLLPCPRTGLSQGLVDGRGRWSRTAC
jgi:hypothetical protein